MREMSTQTWLFAILYLYLFLLFVKNSAEGRGAARSIFFVAAIFVVPSAAFIHLAGGWDISASGSLNGPAAPWVVAVPNPSGGAPHHLNLVLGVFTLSLIYILASLIVALFASLYDHRGDHVHALYKPFVKWGIFLLGIFFYLSVSGISLSTLFLGMGALSLVIGFGLQETMANLFTGIALDVEGVVRRGNWVKLDDHPAGKVVEKGWRSTRIRTIRDETVVIPNRSLAGGRLTAYGAFNEGHARVLSVCAGYREPPQKVKEVLRQILFAEPKVLKEPGPRIQVASYGDHAIEYRMMFWIANYGDHIEIEDSILTRVWYAFEAEGIEIPFPTRNLVVKSAEETKRDAEMRGREHTSVAGFLASIPPLEEHLGRSEIEYLGRNASMRRYHPGETLLQRGETGDSVYFVREGHCEVTLPSGEAKKLGAGEFFGEMALFHEGVRTADVRAGREGAWVARIGRETMQKVFGTHPDLETSFALTHEIRKEESGITAPGKHRRELTGLESAAAFVRRWLIPW